MAQKTLANTIDIDIEPAVISLLTKLEKDYHVLQAYLFGSRARHTYTSESDVDIAVIIPRVDRTILNIALEMSDIAYDVLLEDDVYIQVFPIFEDEWNDEQKHSNPSLIKNIKRDGVLL